MIRNMIQKLLSKKLNKKGFTLVELIVVIVIIAILAAVMLPLISGYINEARNSRTITQARNAYMALVAIVGFDYASGILYPDKDAHDLHPGTTANLDVRIRNIVPDISTVDAQSIEFIITTENIPNLLGGNTNRLTGDIIGFEITINGDRTVSWTSSEFDDFPGEFLMTPLSSRTIDDPGPT